MQPAYAVRGWRGKGLVSRHCYAARMTRHIITTLALLALTTAFSVGLLHARDPEEEAVLLWRVDLAPGWNVVSLPYRPLGTEMESIIGADSQVDAVMEYAQGDWLVAVRNDGGRWHGTQSNIPSGRLFLVHTPIAEPLDIELWPTWPTLISFLFAGGPLGALGGQGTEQPSPSKKVSADEAFDDYCMQFGLAQGFNNTTKQWKLPTRPDSGETVEAGAGYWVWFGRFGGLCP